VEHCEVGVGAFLPTGEDAAEAIQPGVGALDDPATSAEAGLAFDRVRFFAAAADVGGEAERGCELAYLVVVVAAVEAEPLWPLPGRRRSLDRDRLDRLAGQLEVVAVRAGRADPDRDALALGEERSFRPFLALSVGFGPVCSPPSGALPRAVHRQPLPLDPTLGVVGEQPLPPELKKHARVLPTRGSADTPTNTNKCRSR